MTKLRRFFGWLLKVGATDLTGGTPTTPTVDRWVACGCDRGYWRNGRRCEDCIGTPGWRFFEAEKGGH